MVYDTDLAEELILRAPRQHDGPRIGAKLVAKFCDDAGEVRTEPIHLVDERYARNTISISLSPDRFTLRLHATDAAEYSDGAIQHAQRPLDLGREVHVAGGIDDVEPVRLVGEKARQFLHRFLRPGTGRGC